MAPLMTTHRAIGAYATAGAKLGPAFSVDGPNKNGLLK